jgi:metal-responsive CopG/Arc/MetJ family transcriptional regulator
MTNLTEQVKVRIDRSMKAQLAVERSKQNRSEGAIVRIALREYLNRQRKGATA